MTLLGGGWTLFDYSPKSYDAIGDMTSSYLVTLANSNAHIGANQIYFGGNLTVDSTLENVNGNEMFFLGPDSQFCSYQRFKTSAGSYLAPNTVSIFSYELGCLMTFDDMAITPSNYLVGFTDYESAAGTGYQNNKYDYSFSVYMRENFDCFGLSEYDTEFVCGGHGTCNGTDSCVCDANYFGPECELTTCFGVQSDSPLVCSGNNGTCISFNTCNCTTGYEGEQCSLPVCFGLPSNDSQVCSGNGVCSSPDVCSCHAGFTGEDCFDKGNCTAGYGDVNCTTPICYGVLGSDLGVCSGNGACVAPNDCDCDIGYAGSDCSKVTCFDIPADDPRACNANGTCTNVDTCTCNAGYLGAECTYPTCYSVDSRNVSACYGNGKCIAPDVCQCYEGYTGEMCTMPYCFGIFYTDPAACSGNGSCVNKDTCNCKPGHIGVDCSIKTCFKTQANDSSVCSGNGVCVDVDQCECEYGYFGSNCSTYSCFGYDSSDPRACSGNGFCQSPDVCNCLGDYADDRCLLKMCYGVLSNESSVCSGNGDCVDLNKCTCDAHYLGSQCQHTTCYGTLSNVTASVCSGHGTCSAYNNCTCNNGYTKGNCSVPICYSVNGDSASVCSGHGTCSKPDTCVCAQGYVGDQCQTVTCSSLSATDPKVCNGRGVCGSYNKCTCTSGFSGNNCETVDTCSGDYTLALSGSSAQTVSLSDSSCETVLASIPTVQLATPQHSVFNGNALYLFKSNSIHVVPFTSTSTLSSTDLSISITTSTIVGVQATKSALYAFVTSNGVPAIIRVDLATKETRSLSLTGFTMSTTFNNARFMTLNSDSLFCIAQNAGGHAVLKVDLSLTTFTSIFTFSTLDVESLLIINGSPALIKQSILSSIVSGNLQQVTNLATTGSAFLSAPITSKTEASNKIYLVRDLYKHVTVLNSDGSISSERKLPVDDSTNYRILGRWKPTISALSSSLAVTTTSSVIGLTGTNLLFGTRSTLTVQARQNTAITFSLALKSCSGLNVQADACVETGVQNWGDVLISNTTLSVVPVSGYKPVQMSDDLTVMFYNAFVSEISLTTAPQTITGNVNVRVVYIPLTAATQCKYTLGSTGSTETVGTVVSHTQVSCPLPKLDSFSGTLRVTISAGGLSYQSNAFITITTATQVVNEFSSPEAITLLLEAPASSGGTTSESRPSVLEIVYVEKYANRTMLKYGSTLDTTKKERTTMKFKDKYQLYGNTISFNFLIPSASTVAANLIEQLLRDGDDYLMAAIIQDASGSKSVAVTYQFGANTETASSACPMEIGTLYSLQTKAVTPDSSQGKWIFKTQLLLDSTVVCEATITSPVKLSILNPYIANSYDLLMGQSVGFGASARKVSASQELDIFLSSASTGCEQASCDVSTMPKPPVSPASKGWIAAAVIVPLVAVGVLIALAVLTVIVFILIRRKQNTKAVSKMVTQNIHTFRTEDFEEMREI